MSRRWTAIVSIFVLALSILIILLQFQSADSARYLVTSLSGDSLSAHSMEQVTNLSTLEEAAVPIAGGCRKLDWMLPPNCRVYMEDMVGLTNASHIGFYYFLSYYLFPRPLEVAIDQPARLTPDGYKGKVATSDKELRESGILVVIKQMNGKLAARSTLPVYQLEPKSSPEWFPSCKDKIIAFLLPLLTAVSGMLLVRFLFSGLWGHMALLEQLACGLGLGMLAVGALTLGVKLCGFRGYYWVLALTALGAAWELWSRRGLFKVELPRLAWGWIRNPVFLVGLLAFLIMFREAASLPLTEYDSVANWALKAKIFHLCTGSEIVRWFAEPRLSHAHFDYPTLVPALHAATYDSLGRVNECVTKFWPVWMMVLLMGGVSANTAGRWKGLHVAAWFLLALALLPVSRKFMEMEGGTLPMVFFTVLGMVEWVRWRQQPEPERLALAVVLLFGGAMAKFEGFIFLAAAGGWFVLLPAMRGGVKLPSRWWQPLVFCLLAALPWLYLRLHSPVLHYESGWLGYAVHHPGVTLASWPVVFMMVLSRWFVSPGLASWTVVEDHLYWTGSWGGLDSLYNHPTLGLVWVCVLLSLVLWFARPARRGVLVWILLVIGSTIGAFSLVFSSFVSLTSFDRIIGYTTEETALRYLLPMLMMWACTLLVLLFEARSPGQPETASIAVTPNREGSLALKTNPENR